MCCSWFSPALKVHTAHQTKQISCCEQALKFPETALEKDQRWGPAGQKPQQQGLQVDCTQVFCPQHDLSICMDYDPPICMEDPATQVLVDSWEDETLQPRPGASLELLQGLRPGALHNIRCKFILQYVVVKYNFLSIAFDWCFRPQPTPSRRAQDGVVSNFF